MRDVYLLFWYQVLTWVSVRLSLAASSSRSWTLRYFWRSKLFSNVCSWWSVNAVRALRCLRLHDDGDGCDDVGRDEDLTPPPDALFPPPPCPPRPASSSPVSLLLSSTSESLSLFRTARHKNGPSVRHFLT